MNIISRADCGLRAPVRPLDPMPLPTVVGIVVHYVGADLPANPTDQQSRQTWLNIQTESINGIRNTFYSDIPYSFGFDPLGRVYEGRGWGFQNAANGDSFSNSHTWAICYLGGPDNPITDAAKAALVEFCQTGARMAPTCSYVKPHSAVFNTSCPGDSVRNFLPSIQLHPPSIPTHRGQNVIIPAPVRPGDDPNRPKCVALDAVNKQLRLMNGAKVLPANTAIPSNSDVIDWYPNPTGFTVIAKPIDASGTYPAFHYTWA